MPLSIEELVALRQIIGDCLKLAYEEQTINRLLESERVVVREIKLKTTNFVTGNRLPSFENLQFEPKETI